ncbi:hypothetical protein FBPa8_0033 [Pseudomonas phage vB_PaeP_FBPa8]|nr:hypothetical protein FBPa8_0033 [Pseudomonas phage vB_PaeP_FBPa8]
MSKVYVLFERDEYGHLEVIAVHRTLKHAEEDAHYFNERRAVDRYYYYVEGYDLID